MILNCLLLLPLALAPDVAAAASPPVAVAEAVRADDLEQLVSDQLAGVSGASIDEVWRRAAGLRAVARAEAEEDLDRVLDQFLRRPADLTSRGTLLLASCRLQGDDPDGELLAQALRPLLDAEDEPLARSAASLLSDTLFKKIDSELRGELLDELLAGARAGDRGTEYRLACARTAHAIGSGEDRRRARKEILAFLASADPELRAQGALALADAGDEVAGILEEELRRLATLPTEEGALARSYLKQEDLRRLHERRFKNLERLYEENLPSEELRLISAVMRMIREEHLDGAKFDNEELMNAALDGMLRVLDQHSSYMSSDSYGRFYQELEAEYGGIGAYVGEDPADGLFTITKPIYSGPAYRAGLGTDDKIVRIDDWPTLGQPVDDIIKRLKGKPGTKVKLYVWHRGMDAGLIERPTDNMVVEVVRERISIPAVQIQMLPGNIGLVELSTFSRVASETLRAGLEQLLDDGMEGLVLDLRYNSGGLLPEAVHVADLFLPKGKLVVTTDSRYRRPEHYYTRSAPVIPEDMPMVVLINRFTASASEIVSGALADNDGRAYLVGERTYGKGSVQTLIPVEGLRDDQYFDENKNGRRDNWEEITRDWDSDGEFDWAPRVKMTIARYLLPSGRSIHRELDRDRNVLQEGGIEPDEIIYPKRPEGWRVEEQRRILGEHRVRQYVDEHWQEHRERFLDLAQSDRKDPARYPDFEPFYDSLDTVLPREDVRFLVRREVRRRVQDERGAEFPFGDYQEDLVVQAGIRRLLADLGRDYGDVEEYAATFADPSEAESAPAPVARGRDPEEFRATLALIEEARDGDGHLSKETLERVLDILSELEN